MKEASSRPNLRLNHLLDPNSTAQPSRIVNRDLILYSERLSRRFEWVALEARRSRSPPHLRRSPPPLLLCLPQAPLASSFAARQIEGSQATARLAAELLRSVISQQRIPHTNQAGALIDAVKVVGEKLIAANPALIADLYEAFQKM